MSLVSNLQNFATRVATELKAHRTLINGNLSDLSTLSTSAKNNLVAAINEVKDQVDTVSSGGIATTLNDLTDVTLTTPLEGHILVRNSSGQFVNVAGDTLYEDAGAAEAMRLQVKEEILGSGVPAALDTLDELAAALGDDSNFATTTSTALGNRLRIDTAAQGLTETQKNNGRTNLDVYSKAEVGNVDTDFVATFNAGLV